MNYLDNYTELLGDATCIVVKNGKTLFVSRESGIKPLLSLYETDKKSLCGATVCDKIIGRAAAMLITLGKAAEVYGDVMSDGAIRIFDENSIKYFFRTRTTVIENRLKNGICPFEEAVADAGSLADGYERIRARAKLLSQ